MYKTGPIVIFNNKLFKVTPFVQDNADDAYFYSSNRIFQMLLGRLVKKES